MIIVTLIAVTGIFAPLCMTRPAEHKNVFRQIRRRTRGKCEPKVLVEYNLTFYGDWSPKLFPKLYPRVRPPAQWSKLVGRSHDDTYQLWSLGKNCTEAVKKFAEDADSSLLDQDAQAYRGIFDSFTAAPITSGMGRSGVRFLTDGEHTKMSFMVKIIPSPDWFIGIDSLDLCKNGRWRRKISVDLSPLDAGTDQGFTFTSPNWPSIPVETIKTITNTDPAHPASSFYYPEEPKLPRIGHVTLTKVAEYRRRGRKKPYAPTGPNVVIFDSEEEETDDSINYEIRHSDKFHSSPYTTHVDNNSDTGNSDKPQDCEVSEWGPWSSCSQTCGYGFQIRERRVVKNPTDGGLGCPNLREQHTCGTMTKCNWNHFSYLFRRSG